MPPFSDSESNYTYELIIEPSETANGKEEWTYHWEESDYGISFETIIPVTGHTHTLEKHEAIPVSCTEAGSKLYYSCSCGLYFEDEDALWEISENSWIISAQGHEYSYQLVAAPSYSMSGQIRGLCSCGDTVKIEIPKLNETDYVMTLAASSSISAGLS